MKVEQRHHGEKVASAMLMFCTAFCMFVKGLDAPFPKSCLYGAGSWRQSVRFACGLFGTCCCKTGESGCAFWLAASGGVAKPLARPQAGMVNDVVIRFLHVPP